MKILVIEDELELLGAISGILSKEGFEVEMASGMSEARAKIRNYNYDLIVCDIMLPHWGGFDLIDAIKESPGKQNTPVIVITGMDEEILKSTHLFAEACLQKPFTGKQLLETVHSLLQPEKQITNL